MREIDVKQITDVVEKLCIEANEHLPEDVKCAIKNCRCLLYTSPSPRDCS